VNSTVRIDPLFTPLKTRTATEQVEQHEEAATWRGAEERHVNMFAHFKIINQVMSN
jgi:hypothetical protein